MENNRKILVCDNDEAFLSSIQADLEKEGIAVETISDATQLISRAERTNPIVVVANPDAPGFNQYDVCKKLIKERNTRVILIIDKNSTTRNTIDECTADDVLIKPFEVKNLAFLISKHVATNQ